MITQTRAQQLKEIEFQTQMLNNLKKWIRNLIILSSIGIILAYWGLGVQSKMPFTVFGVADGVDEEEAISKIEYYLTKGA